MYQLQDRVAVVTGASQGLGRAIAEAFAVEGAKVVLAARRKDVLTQIASAIEGKGGTALVVRADVTKEADILALFAATRDAYGRLDILVNNAGVPTNTPTEDITLDDWNKVLQVNLTAAFLCSREAIRLMKAQTPQGGRILNIGSISAKTPRADSLPYTATKYALQGLTHQLTLDGRKYGVAASILQAGPTFTGFQARSGRTGPGPGATPADYLMKTSDVARAAVLMCSLPPEVNLYEATILANHTRSFIGRG